VGVGGQPKMVPDLEDKTARPLWGTSLQGMLGASRGLGGIKLLRP